MSKNFVPRWIRVLFIWSFMIPMLLMSISTFDDFIQDIMQGNEPYIPHMNFSL